MLSYGCIEWISLYYLSQLFVQIVSNDRFEPMCSCVWSTFYYWHCSATLPTARSHALSLYVPPASCCCILYMYISIYISATDISVVRSILFGYGSSLAWIFIIVIMIPVWFDSDSPCLFFHIQAACVVHVEYRQQWIQCFEFNLVNCWLHAKQHRMLYGRIQFYP